MSPPLVLSSSGTESFSIVSGMSAEAFLALKKAWKKTNLEEKQHHQLMAVYSSNTKTLTLLNYDRSHLAMSMMRSSCLFTSWLSMMEESRATIHFLRRNMEFSFLRKDNQQLQSSSFHPITFLFRVSRPDRTRVEILRQIIDTHCSFPS